MGLPLFVAPRTISISDLKRFIGGYHEGWTAARHTGRGDIGLTMPVYVAETERQARRGPEARTVHSSRPITQAPKKADASTRRPHEAFSERPERLAEHTS